MNSFGNYFRLTTFGESHGPAIGGIIDGMPPGVKVDYGLIANMMAARHPGQGEGYMSSRKEKDEVELLSGIFEGVTLGTPIGFIIRNMDCRSRDYENSREIWRPSHGDYVYEKKYGVRDWRGGGRASARETACRIVAAAFANMILIPRGIKITASINRIGSVEDDLEAMKNEARTYAREGNSIGGIIKCCISGAPIGCGEPVYNKFSASLASAMLSIPGAKGFDYGLGFDGVVIPGSEYNDPFGINPVSGEVYPVTNNSGGIQGGITNGRDIVFRVVFKPAPSISLGQNTVDVNGKPGELKIKGRHDACIVFRALPVVEAMAAIVTLDHLLWAHL